MARRRKKKTSFAQKCLDEVRERGETLVEPPCAFADPCGGCSWQRMAYQSQLGFKQQVIADAFAAQELGAVPIPDVVAPERTYGYRNHMEFSFSARRWLTEEEIASGRDYDRSFALGLHAPGGFGRVLDLEYCHLQSEAMNRVFEAVRTFVKDHELAPYHHRDHTGFWRFLIIRESLGRGDILVHIVTRERDEAVMKAFVSHILEHCPEVACVSNGVTDSVADTSMGATVHVDSGDGLIVEEVGGLCFEVSPASFFQPNSETAAILFRQVADLAGDVSGQRVLDLFCGTGTLSLVMAKQGADVVGLEMVEEAVDCARRNAVLNELENVRFEVRDLMQGLPEDLGEFDLVVSDPPRAGMHKKTIRQLIELRPPRIVSVGCNPKTQAENIRELQERAGYRVERMLAVDQFPQTPHVENLALLVRDGDAC